MIFIITRTDLTVSRQGLLGSYPRIPGFFYRKSHGMEMWRFTPDSLDFCSEIPEFSGGSDDVWMKPAVMGWMCDFY